MAHCVGHIAVGEAQCCSMTIPPRSSRLAAVCVSVAAAVKHCVSSATVPCAVQVSGYAVEFKAGLTFATVKGGGHMVPQTHPQAALSLLQQWLRQEL